MNKLSIIIPVYNEQDTLRKCIEKLVDIFPHTEIIIIDDCSIDNSATIAYSLLNKYEYIRVYENKKNIGKGFTINEGLFYANGNIIAIQDADLEYDPNDLKKLVDNIIVFDYDMVIGSRFLGESYNGRYRYRLANNFLTWLSNRLTGLKLTDMESCYKVFRSGVIKNINEKRFGIEPELIAKFKHLKIKELPISYNARKKGKKIKFKDGLQAIWCIIKYNWIK